MFAYLLAYQYKKVLYVRYTRKRRVLCHYIMRNANKEELISYTQINLWAWRASTPGGLREVADIVAGPLPVMFENSWRSGNISDDWKSINVICVFRKGPKEDPGNYRPVSLPSIPRKIIERVLLENITKRSR